MRVALIGAGGHARVVLDAARAEGRVDVIAVLDARRELHGTSFEGVPIVGAEDELARLRDEGLEGVLLGVGSIDAGPMRRQLYERVHAYGLDLPSVRHPKAIVAQSAVIGSGTVVFAAAVLNPGARVGANVIVNTGALIEHDVVVGDHTHLSPGVRIAGGVRIGEMSHIGIGSVIIQRVVIGDRALVAAGAVVTKDVEAGARVGGVPARPLPARD